jgi:hypothetical protein
LQQDGKNRATPPMAGTLTPFIAGPLAVNILASALQQQISRVINLNLEFQYYENYNFAPFSHDFFNIIWTDPT